MLDGGGLSNPRTNLKGDLQVIYIHVIQRHFFEAGRIRRILEEESRNPVVALVVLDGGCSTLRVQQVVTSGVDTKVASSHNTVVMGCLYAGVDDGVHRPFGQELIAGEVQDGKGHIRLDGRSHRGQRGQGTSSCDPHVYFVSFLLYNSSYVYFCVSSK